MSSTAAGLAALGALLASPVEPVGDQGRVVEFPEHHLRLELPALEGLAEADAEEGLRTWEGGLGESRVRITFSLMDGLLYEPEDVTDRVASVLQEQDEAFRVAGARLLRGELGSAPFASIIEADMHGEDGAVVGRQIVLGGLLEVDGYVVHVQCWPAPGEAESEAIDSFLAKGMTYEGPERDPDWTLEEIEARWLRDAPDDLHEDFQRNLKKKKWLKDSVIRTEHYLILTNSSGGKLFAEKMEENYDEIAEIFPHEEVEGRRLMPVFLFLTPDQYYDYYEKVTGAPREKAERTKGHAWRDYYATWYEAPQDPVHIHEQVHQYFDNRLRLSGGGSWLQEGVAEYVETRPNDRNEVARLVEKGQHTPLRELFALESLLHSTQEDVKGGSRAGDNYTLSALLIEFLRESDFGEEGFPAFLQIVGHVPYGEVEPIEAALQEVYGVSIEELEERFRAYCEKR